MKTSPCQCKPWNQQQWENNKRNQEKIARRYYSTCNRGDKVYYHPGKMDLRAHNYTDLRDSSPSPLRNISQRNWYERNANRRLHRKEDYKRNNTLVYPRHTQAFDGRSTCGSDRHRPQPAGHGIGLPYGTKDYNRRPHVAAPSPAKVKRCSPADWIRYPSSSQPVNKQRKTGERHRHHDIGSRPTPAREINHRTTSSSGRPQTATASIFGPQFSAVGNPILPGTTSITPPVGTETVETYKYKNHVNRMKSEESKRVTKALQVDKRMGKIAYSDN